MNIHIKTLIAIIGLILVGLTALMTFFIFQLHGYSSELKAIEHNRHIMIEKADELRQSSDDLTRFARTYVITGEEQYKENFYKILDIRNGTAPRPQKYSGIYWDLLEPLRTARHPDGETIALKESMARLPYINYEFDKLKEAEFNSNDLVNMEVEAFNAMKGLFKDSEGHYSIQGRADQQRAIELLHSDAYHKAKEKIMLPIDEFLESLDERTRIAIKMVNEEIDWMFTKIFVLLSIGSTLYLLTYLVLRKKVLIPISMLTHTILQFKKGEKDLKAFPTYRDEIGLMARQFFSMKKSVDEAHESLEDKVELRTRALQQANEKLQEMDRLKSLFIASMSHELRTPLNAIIGFSGVLLKDLSQGMDEKQIDYLHRVNRTGKHLMGLISDIIDISKIEAGCIELQSEVFDLEAVVEEAAEAISYDLKRKGLKLDIEVAEWPRVETDRKRLLQCLYNYLGNAVKYSESGTITMRITSEEQMLRIEVHDTGIGIGSDDRKRLFKAFERLESHLTVQAGGTGLGLYLTKKIVEELLGGEVGFESELGKGSRFWLLIPKKLKV